MEKIEIESHCWTLADCHFKYLVIILVQIQFERSLLLCVSTDYHRGHLCNQLISSRGGWTPPARTQIIKTFNKVTLASAFKKTDNDPLAEQINLLEENMFRGWEKPQRDTDVKLKVQKVSLTFIAKSGALIWTTIRRESQRHKIFFNCRTFSF